MIAITDHAEGCVLAVRAQPGARRNTIIGEQGSALKVAVTAPPEGGRANKALVETLAKELGIKRSHVQLLAGHTSREKKFLIRGLRAQELRVQLASVLEETAKR